jgi:carbon-monoxide dehydrogenase small subunit
MTQTIRLQVNGQEHTLEVPPQRLLLDCLRYDLGLTGSKEGCSIGVCGACTVMMDGKIVSSCLMFAAAAAGKEIVTIEGLAHNTQLHPLQQAFIDHGGFQCGICTPGMIMAAQALLTENPDPTVDEIKDWMMGNLCRCTGYYKIIESIQAAAAQMQGKETA